MQNLDLYIITKPGNPISFGPKDERITPLPAQKFGGLCKMDQTLASEEGSDLGRAMLMEMLTRKHVTKRIYFILFFIHF
jgi:hypothetical protein